MPLDRRKERLTGRSRLRQRAGPGEPPLWPGLVGRPPAALNATPARDGANGCGVQIGVAHLDGEPSPLRHRVPGVGDQVKDGLFELIGIDFNRAQVGSKYRSENNLFPDEPSKQFLGVDNDIIQIEDYWIDNMFPTKDEELLRQRCSSLSGAW